MHSRPATAAFDIGAAPSKELSDPETSSTLGDSCGDVSVCHACLDVGPSSVRALEATLSRDDLARAARFHFERDRLRFVVARGILRSLLGAALLVEPSRLRFAYTDRGKPFLPDDFGRERVFFNVAHSHGHGMFAVAAHEVGVDIEGIRPVPNAVAISDRFFSPRESAAIRALPAPLRLTAFFHCWTRKEAYLKGLGEGLATCEEQNGAAAWQLHDLSQLPTYAAAVAVKGPPARIRVRSWDARFQNR